MKYFSMFSGIGGFELGIKERANCIGFSEIDRYAIQIYKQHFPKHRNWGNARDIIAEELPDFDLLVGGFPCQSFSIAGKRGGFEDTRGTLFFEIARIVKVKRPQLLLLENVKGLLSHDSGQTFGTILATLSDLGYVLEWQVLNSKNFGVPQNRERVFIIGHLGGISGRTIFPIGEGNQGNFLRERGTKPKTKPASAVTTREGGRKENNFVVERTPLKFLERNQKNIEGDYAFTVDGANTGGVKISYNTHSKGKRYTKMMDLSLALAANSESDRGLLHQDQRIRRLTPTECERLQGFPDSWTEKGKEEYSVYNKSYTTSYRRKEIKLSRIIKISDTQRYKCLGNAVTVNVIEAIMKSITGRLEK